MLTLRLIKFIAKSWAEDSKEYKRLLSIREQVRDLFKDYADKHLTKEEKEYIERKLPFRTIDSIGVDIKNGYSNLENYILRTNSTALSSLKNHPWGYYSEATIALSGMQSGGVIRYLDLPDNLPSNIFFYSGSESRSFKLFVRKNPEFMKALAALLVEHELIQQKLLDKTKLIIDDLARLNLTDLKKHYKELYDYAKKA